jgi:hypothetical protein
MKQCSQNLLPTKRHQNWTKKADRSKKRIKTPKHYHMRNFHDFFIPFSRLSSSDKLPLLFPLAFAVISHNLILRLLITNWSLNLG